MRRNLPGAVADPITENRLELSLSGLQALTVYTEEAGLDLEAPLTLDVETNAHVRITLVGSAETVDVAVSAGTAEKTV